MTKLNILIMKCIKMIMKFNDKIYEQKKIENFIMINLFFLLTAA